MDQPPQTIEEYHKRIADQRAKFLDRLFRARDALDRSDLKTAQETLVPIYGEAMRAIGEQDKGLHDASIAIRAIVNRKEADQQTCSNLARLTSEGIAAISRDQAPTHKRGKFARAVSATILGIAALVGLAQGPNAHKPFDRLGTASADNIRTNRGISPTGKNELANSLLKDRLSRKLAKTLEHIQEFYPFIIKHTNRTGIPEQLAVGLLTQESVGDRMAKSGKGARGPLQVMPRYAKKYFKTNKNQLHDAETGISIGLEMLRDKIVYYQSRGYQDATVLGLAAYNCGEGKVNEALARVNPNKEARKTLTYGQIEAQLSRETRQFVPLVLKFTAEYTNSRARAILQESANLSQ